jgi:hypothetical protein
MLILNRPGIIAISLVKVGQQISANLVVITTYPLVLVPPIISK